MTRHKPEGPKLYEAMVIVDSSRAKEDYEKVEAEVLACMTRQGAEIVKSVKWDERRLAYPIKRQKRGTYILVHFKVLPDAIVRIERQARITDAILAILILVDEDGVETKTGNTGRSEESRGRGGRRESGRHGSRGGRSDDRGSSRSRRDRDDRDRGEKVPPPDKTEDKAEDKG